MILFLLFSLLRILFVQLLAVMWWRIPLAGLKSSRKMFSVLVPVRNEAENIINLLKDLEDQNYPVNQFEVIVADDHSEDGTARLVESYSKKSSLKIKLIRLSDQEGKKAAITTAISHASNEFILATDGDCRLPENWIKAFASCYDQNEGTLMVTGPVLMPVDNLFTSIQSMEFSALIGFGGASLQMGLAGTCNGANISYRKDTFQKVGGYRGNEKIPSGDDEFLMFKIFNKYNKGITFLKSAEAVVRTQPKKNLKDLVNQRIRWSSKWRFHKSNYITIAALLFFIDYSILITVVSLTLTGKMDHTLVASVLLLRWLTEYYYISSVLRFLRGRPRWLNFLLMQIIYPLFVIFLGFASIFGIYHWKGRAYS